MVIFIDIWSRQSTVCKMYNVSTQVIGRLFSPSQKLKKWTQRFRLCFQLGMGILNSPCKFFLVVYEPHRELRGLQGVGFQGKNCFIKMVPNFSEINFGFTFHEPHRVLRGLPCKPRSTLWGSWTTKKIVSIDLGRYQNVILLFSVHFFMVCKAKIDFGEVWGHFCEAFFTLKFDAF